MRWPTPVEPFPFNEDLAPEVYTVKRSPDGQRFRVKRYASHQARHPEAVIVVTRQPGESDVDCLARAERSLEAIVAGTAA